MTKKFEVKEMEHRLEMARWYGFVESNQKLDDGVTTDFSVGVGAKF